MKGGTMFDTQVQSSNRAKWFILTLMAVVVAAAAYFLR
jgi:hypothetical protein